MEPERLRSLRQLLWVNCGSLWCHFHLALDAQWFGHALIVEHRYAWGLAQGMKDAGLVLA
jgi:hypothetical protein